jgi:hypothetical protein
MRRAAWFGGTAAVLAAAGLAYLAAEHVAQGRLEGGLQTMRAELGPGATLRYAHAAADPFTLGATLDQAAITRDDAVLTADRVMVHGVHATRIGRLELVNPSLRRNGIVAGAADLTVDDLAPDPGASQPDAIRFGHAAVSALLVTLAALPGGTMLPGGATPTDAATGSGPALVFRSGAVQIDDVASDRPGHVLLQDAALTTAAGGRTTVQADALRYDETALADTLNRLLSGHAGARPARDKVTLEGGPLAISGSGRAPVRAASLRAVAIRDGGVATAFTLHGVEAKLAPSPGSFAAQLGYDRIEADLTTTSRLDPGSGHVVLGPLVVDARDMAVLRMNATLTAAATAAGTALDWRAMQLADGQVSITDKGLTQHILAAIGRQHGLTAAALRDQLAAKLQQAPDSAGTAPLTAAMRFLVQSGTLTFTAQPPAPLALAALAGLRGQGLPALMTAIGLQVRSSP